MEKNTQESIIKYLDSSPKKVAKFILRDKKAEYGANIKKYRDIKIFPATKNWPWVIS